MLAAVHKNVQKWTEIQLLEILKKDTKCNNQATQLKLQWSDLHNSRQAVYINNLIIYNNNNNNNI